MRAWTGREFGCAGWRRAATVALAAVLLTACASVERIPYTQQEQELAIIPGIPEARD